MSRIREYERAMRAKCLDCCGGMRSEVRGCGITTCPLWPYRGAGSADGGGGAASASAGGRAGSLRRVAGDGAELAGQMDLSEALMEAMG